MNKRPDDLRTARAFFWHALIGILLWTAGIATVRAETTGADCLALAVFTEARGESWLGQAAVAQVALNRAADPRWPDDLCSVVSQPEQFHGVRDWPKGREPIDVNPRAWRQAQAVAVAVMLADYVVAPTLCASATHFWAGPTPSWARGLKVVCEIDSHTFAIEVSQRLTSG